MSSSTTLTNHLAPNTKCDIPQSVFTLRHTAQLEALYTIIRDKNTSRGDFIFYSDRIIRLLVEEGLNHLPVVPKVVETPTVRTTVRMVPVLIKRRASNMRVSALREKFAACPSCVQERCASQRDIIYAH